MLNRLPKPHKPVMKRIRPFDTRQLEAFEVLCSTGSFTETAKRLFLTQSAVSHSMKSLEEECGSRLLRRQGKKVTLTEAGDRLLRFARPFSRRDEKGSQGAGRVRKVRGRTNPLGSRAHRPAVFCFRLFLRSFAKATLCAGSRSNVRTRPVALIS